MGIDCGLAAISSLCNCANSIFLHTHVWRMRSRLFSLMRRLLFMYFDYLAHSVWHWIETSSRINTRAALSPAHYLNIYDYIIVHIKVFDCFFRRDPRSRRAQHPKAINLMLGLEVSGKFRSLNTSQIRKGSANRL